MAYTLYTQSFGSVNANAKVSIAQPITAVPAIILASASGGVVSDKGIASLDTSGNLSVYIDTAISWVVTLIDEVFSQQLFLNQTQIAEIQTLVSRSGEIDVSTGSGITVATGPGVLIGFRIKSLGASPTVTIYNNTTGSAPTLLTSTSISNFPLNTVISFPIGLVFTTGCHVVVGGTGTTIIGMMVD